VARAVERSTLLLSSSEVAKCLRMDEAISAVDAAFRKYHRKEASMPPKSYIDLPDHQGLMNSMPARVGNAVAVKWVSAHVRNPEHGLPTVLGTLILSEPETGYPLAVMDATLLTAFRSGAASAVATRALARDDAHSLGVIGCGTQAAYQIAALSLVRDLRTLVLADTQSGRAEALAERIRHLHPSRLDVQVDAIQQAAAQDIVCTLTPVHKPIVKADWVERGAHVNALGADAAGKQEIESDLLANAVIVVDDWEQATHSGEVNVPLSTGELRREHIRGTLGAILEGAIPGRTKPTEITIFDSTGLAIQDAALARVVYERARKEGLGSAVTLVPTLGSKAPDVLDQMKR
jgi:alanine dehydrogenase